MEEYQIKRTGEFRVRKKFSFFPFIIVNSLPIWTNKWFQYVEIREEKILERFMDFNDGWSYQMYWKPWEQNWEFIALIR
jgi:hypothetical protein